MSFYDKVGPLGRREFHRGGVPEQLDFWGRLVFVQTHLGVPMNGGTPKWMIYSGTCH